MYNKRPRWRPIVDKWTLLTDYLKSAINKEEYYEVLSENRGTTLPFLDHHSKLIKKWDFIMLILLVWTALVIPFETAFKRDDAVDIMFLINRVVDCLFLFDMFLQCLRPYTDSRTGALIRNHFKIFKRYFQSWFIIDLLSVLPFELIGFFFDSSQLTNLSLLRLLRFLRLTRLLKLLRITRASRVIKQLKSMLNIRFVRMTMIKVSYCVYNIHYHHNI